MEELNTMEQGSETNEGQTFERVTRTQTEPLVETSPAPTFVKVEKNLASLGFFTPSSKRLRNAQEKSFTITTVADGQRLELKGTIIPSAKYGLPVTADQDKWIALCKIITDIMSKEGRVTNPVSFTSAEILRLLHKHRHSGKNYREIEQWLDVLFSTTIFSEGVVYLAKEKRHVKDRFRVFDRVVSLGKQLSNGMRADKNYVWFSEWQLDNINNNHLLPVDLDAYRDLKNHIAKALVPLLQVWLYATRDKGVFEKRYDELCQFLNIQHYPYESLIKRTLGPSLDELKQFGYLADWRIDRTNDGENFKILLYHGEKFHRDRRARLERKKNVAPGNTPRIVEANADQALRGAESKPSRPTFDPQLVAELTNRGIRQEIATNLLAKLKPGQDVIARLEYSDQEIKKLENTEYRVTNPAGYHVRMIEWNSPVPDGFETSARRKAREQRERQDQERRAAEEADRQRQDAYENYCSNAVDRCIEENRTLYDGLKETKLAEEREKHPSTAWPDLLARAADWAAKYEIQKSLNLPTFEEFVAREEARSKPSLNPLSQGTKLASATPDESKGTIETVAHPENTPEALDPIAHELRRRESEAPQGSDSGPQPLVLEIAHEPTFVARDGIDANVLPPIAHEGSQG
jgi:Replication initiator protein A